MTAAELSQKMAARSAQLSGAAAAAVQQAGEEALDAGKQAMEEKIYRHPIPTTKAGKPKWKQTRNLINHERLEPDADGLSVRLVNDMIYAHRRHELAPPTTKWPAHWRDEAIARAREQFSARIARAIRSVWERR